MILNRARHDRIAPSGYILQKADSGLPGDADSLLQVRPRYVLLLSTANQGLPGIRIEYPKGIALRKTFVRETRMLVRELFASLTTLASLLTFWLC